MSRVSILMAVYNSAAYLEQSLDSVLAQTYRDIELICIDDASTDGSGAILDDYARRDARIKVIHLTENGGQAAARNRGLKVCTGDLIAYLDSDDWLSADCMEQAVTVFDTHPAADCVLLSVKIYDNPSGIFEDYAMQPFEVLTGTEAFEASLDWTIHGVYVARRPLYDAVPFDASCRAFSDDNTTRLHYYRSREVRLCSGIYYYRRHAGSVSQRKDAGYFQFLRANESMKRQLEALGVGERILRLYECQRMLVLADCYQVYHRQGRDFRPRDRRHALSELRRVWHTLERRRLTSPKVRKFGYRKMPWWWLFRLQEWAYFTLRGWLRKS